MPDAPARLPCQGRGDRNRRAGARAIFKIQDRKEDTMPTEAARQALAILVFGVVLGWL